MMKDQDNQSCSEMGEKRMASSPDVAEEKGGTELAVVKSSPIPFLLYHNSQWHPISQLQLTMTGNQNSARNERKLRNMMKK